MRFIKVCIVSLHPTYYHSGIWRRLSNLKQIDLTVYYLSELGMKGTFDPEFNTTRHWADKSVFFGFKYRFIKNYAKLTYGYGFFSRFNPGIIKLLYKKYDVVLLHGYDTISMWAALVTALICKTSIMWRGEVVLDQTKKKQFLRNIIKRVMLKFLFNRCDTIFYSCSGNREYLRHYGASEDKLSLLPCAVDNDFFQQQNKYYSSKLAEIRNELGINSDDFVVVYSGRLTDRKRPQDLISAIAKTKKQKIVALFIGDGPNMESLKNYAIKMGVRSIFVGYKTQKVIARFYSIANAGVILSSYDPSPKSLNEIMNFSLPVIVTDVVGTSRDLVKRDCNGFIVPIGDIDVIASHLSFLFNDEAGAIKMGKESLRIIQEWNFSEDVRAINIAIKENTSKKCN